MQIDRFTKVCLLAIVVLLTIISVKPFFEPRDSYAAKKTEYIVAKLPSIDNLRSLEGELNKYGTGGWEVIYYENSGGTILIRK